MESILQDIITGEVYGSVRVEGIGEKSFFSMIDEMTRRIKLSFKLSPDLIAEDIDRNIGEITTNSPEALKNYTEGYRYMLAADPYKAIPLKKMGTQYPFPIFSS
jgi:hypothetical protein